MTCAWIETSSAETGSSAMMSFGLRASARAMPIALALAAAELVGVAVQVLGLQADHSRADRPTRSRRSCRVAGPWMMNASPTMPPTVMRGFSEE